MNYSHQKRGRVNKSERKFPSMMQIVSTLIDAKESIILTLSMFFFFAIHNLLQEAIMGIDGFEFGIMLGYFEVLGVTLCSSIERKYVAKEAGMNAPVTAYPLLTFCLLSSSSLSNMSLNYINFPTKVIFRSCKIIPTMVISSIINHRIYSSYEYLAALAICIGLVVFVAGTWDTSPSFHFIGITLVSTSVVADSILPNAQEKLFSQGCSRLEVMVYSNWFTLFAMTASTIYSGDLLKLIKLASINHLLVGYLSIYAFVAYIAISIFMKIVKLYGGVAAVLLATARKGLTLVLSFLFFPKEFSWMFVVGSILVLGGLAASSLLKIDQKEKQRQNKKDDIEDGDGQVVLIPNR
mmetsp:Transcript_13141/g.17181  ORF Transcript_13141/g.17181 Transcript_13141/m.17181 type:complete len:351 (+) Transcript_13141:59-1111(+)